MNKQALYKLEEDNRQLREEFEQYKLQNSRDSGSSEQLPKSPTVSFQTKKNDH